MTGESATSPKILGQLALVWAKSPIFSRYSLVAPLAKQFK